MCVVHALFKKPLPRDSELHPKLRVANRVIQYVLSLGTVQMLRARDPPRLPPSHVLEVVVLAPSVENVSFKAAPWALSSGYLLHFQCEAVQEEAARGQGSNCSPQGGWQVLECALSRL